MNAILAIIADGRPAIVEIYREGVEITLLYNFIINPSMMASSKPFRVGSWG
jgi:hypothetical protein